ncbi:hypothetical protein F5880DRAFT_1191665 [Lentinula raphanica]|nr:hypothetical protein F5880DRAFT_1191665 [Lentinula raphanica]
MTLPLSELGRSSDLIKSIPRVSLNQRTADSARSRLRRKFCPLLNITRDYRRLYIPVRQLLRSQQGCPLSSLLAWNLLLFHQSAQDTCESSHIRSYLVSSREKIPRFSVCLGRPVRTYYSLLFVSTGIYELFLISWSSPYDEGPHRSTYTMASAKISLCYKACFIHSNLEYSSPAGLQPPSDSASSTHSAVTVLQYSDAHFNQLQKNSILFNPSFVSHSLVHAS